MQGSRTESVSRRDAYSLGRERSIHEVTSVLDGANSQLGGLGPRSERVGVRGNLRRAHLRSGAGADLLPALARQRAAPDRVVCARAAKELDRVAGHVAGWSIPGRGHGDLLSLSNSSALLM